MRRLATVKLKLAALVWVAFSAVAVAQSPGPLNGKMFGSGSKALVVVLHGDVSSGGPANYHYGIAAKIASANPGVTVLALLRPGYEDGAELKSKGSNNNRRDHYTKRNNTLVAQTIQSMAQQVGTNRVIAVGHSGGAAQVGGVLGLAPGLVDSAILVSCPCNISKWRNMRGRSAWDKSNGQSPHRQITKIAGETRVTLVVGTSDDNTFPALSEEYVSKAKSSGVNATLVPVPGAGHSFNALEGTVLKVVNSEVRR